jgi:hypothetical protein
MAVLISTHPKRVVILLSTSGMRRSYEYTWKAEQILLPYGEVIVLKAAYRGCMLSDRL